MANKRILRTLGGAAYRINVETRCSVAAVLGDNQGNRTVFTGSHSLLRLGNWTVEAVLTDASGKQAEFIVMEPDAPGDKFSVLFQTEADRMEAASLSESWRTEGRAVSAILFAYRSPPSLLTLGDTAGQESQMEALRREVKDAQDSLAAEKSRNETLQDLLTEKLDQYAVSLSERSDGLRKEMSEKLLELERASRTAETLRRDVESAKARIAAEENERGALRRELSEMETLEQARRLDVEQMRKKLQSLRERYQNDADTAQLMSEEVFLTGNEITEAIGDAEKRLQDAEQMLGRMIELREKINDSVQKVILRGAGAIPLDEELGGGSYGGDGVGIAKEDTQSGT